MIAGLAIENLASLVIKQETQKKDFITTTGTLGFIAQDRKVPAVTFSPGDSREVITADLTSHALAQVTTWAGIPKRYADTLVSDERNHELLERNVQHWFEQNNAKRLVRSFIGDGSAIARAFVSDRFQRMDNYELLEAIMPVFRRNGMVVKSSQVTETRLYIQAIDEKLSARVISKHETSDELFGGVVISNSEVGCGSLQIESLLYRHACTNGMIVGKSFQRKHVGSRIGGDGFGDSYEIFSDDTKRLTDAALWAQVRDVMENALSETAFQAVVAKLQLSTSIQLPSNPTHIIEVTGERFGLSEAEQEIAMKHLFEGGDLSLFGLTQAVTRTAQDVQSYDRAIEIERIGSDILGADPAIFNQKN